MYMYTHTHRDMDKSTVSCLYIPTAPIAAKRKPKRSQVKTAGPFKGGLGCRFYRGLGLMFIGFKVVQLSRGSLRLSCEQYRVLNKYRIGVLVA